MIFVETEYRSIYFQITSQEKRNTHRNYTDGYLLCMVIKQ